MGYNFYCEVMVPLMFGFVVWIGCDFAMTAAHSLEVGDATTVARASAA